MKKEVSEDKILRNNISTLGAILGESILKSEGAASFKLVEEIRTLSKSARQGNVKAIKTLSRKLDNLNIKDKTLVVKAFNHFLSLANVAEQHHRIRRKRKHERLSSKQHQNYSLEKSFELLKKKGFSSKKIFNTFVDQDIELVFTAHPTEVLRRSVIHKQHDISKELSVLDNQNLSKWEQIEAKQGLERNVHALWLTEEIRRVRPTPSDEANWGMNLVEDTLWKTVPKYLKKMTRILRDSTGRELPIRRAPLKISSWVGGDRDGNPFVTAQETLKIIVQSRLRFISLVQRDLSQISEFLSLDMTTAKMKKKLGAGGEFPFRDYAKLISSKLEKTRLFWESFSIQRNNKAEKDLYLSKDSILEDLYFLFDTLKEVGAEDLARGKLLDLIRSVQVFSPSLLSLDIRQSADVHENFFQEFFSQSKNVNYLELSEEEKIKKLETLIKSSRLDALRKKIKFSKESQELLNVVDLISVLPNNSFNCYVISMAEKCSHILEVYALQRMAGVKELVQSVPLFETVESLESSVETMQRFFSVTCCKPYYRKTQQIMIGYSDSGKRGGKLSASWSLYKAQKKLTALANKKNIQLEFFHGRGGTVGRGGGPTYLAIQAQPEGTVHNRIRVTEQGEVLRAKYGLTGIALRSLEIYAGSVALSSLEKVPEPNPKWQMIMDLMAKTSEKAYRGFIYENPDFIKFYNAVTPERELSLLKTGSRPKKRSGVASIDSLRAIPWIFAWTQNRCMLPSWLGVGEGLQAAIDSGYLLELKRMYKDWGFFKSTVDLIQMVLAKADMGVFQFYCRQLLNEKTPDLSEDIISRYKNTLKCIYAITDSKALLDKNERLKTSIQLRNPYADPINMLQAHLLSELRKKPNDAKLIRAVVLSINGVAAAMRNTG